MEIPSEQFEAMQGRIMELERENESLRRENADLRRALDEETAGHDRLRNGVLDAFRARGE